MTAASRLRVLHAVRVLGYADATRVGERAALPSAAEDLLLDAQASGHVTWSRFDDVGGWSLTEAGRREGERLLADDLDRRGARAAVESVLVDFAPLNGLVQAACTRWQLSEPGVESGPDVLPDVLADLRHAAAHLAGLERRLVDRLPRFAGYRQRFAAAVDRAAQEPEWIAGIDRESAHRVWFELHEDLLATLGRPR